MKHVAIIPIFGIAIQRSRMLKHIPNSITALNLLSGCISLVFAFNGDLAIASALIGAGALFDFIDGFAARLLKVSSPIGKELDSLADVITFGLAPGVIVFELMKQDPDIPGGWISHQPALAFTAFIIPVFAALRLAKFNTDPRQSDAFYGLPTPASAIFLASLPLLLVQEGLPFGISMEGLHAMATNFYVLASLSVLLSWLMVSEIRLFSLKFKSFGWVENRFRYLFLAMGLLLLIFFRFAGIPLIILLYIFISMALKERA